MAGVAAGVHRKAQGQAFRHGLHFVVPPGGGIGVFQLHGQNVPDIVFPQQSLLLVGQGPGLFPAFREGLSAIGAGEGAKGHGRYHLMGGIEHQPGDLLHRHAGGQILRPFLRGKPPVLIGQKLPGFRQVLKITAVPLQKLHPGIRAEAQGGAVFVFHDHKFSYCIGGGKNCQDI